MTAPVTVRGNFAAPASAPPPDLAPALAANLAMPKSSTLTRSPPGTSLSATTITLSGLRSVNHKPEFPSPNRKIWRGKRLGKC